MTTEETFVFSRSVILLYATNRVELEFSLLKENLPLHVWTIILAAINDSADVRGWRMLHNREMPRCLLGVSTLKKPRS